MSETVLVIAPHHDDEVLGAGGTIRKHVLNGDTVSLCIVTSGIPQDWDEEIITANKKESAQAGKILGIKTTYSLDLPASRLDTLPQKELNDKIAVCINEIKPSIIYTTHQGDIHNDHRLVFHATLVAARPKIGGSIRKVLAYETPSETEWAAPSAASAFLPNVYIDISSTIEAKLKALSAYGTQVRQFPHPRSLEAVAALAKVRGSTIGVEAAEAFMLIRELQ